MRNIQLIHTIRLLLLIAELPLSAVASTSTWTYVGINYNRGLYGEIYNTNNSPGLITGFIRTESEIPFNGYASHSILDYSFTDPFTTLNTSNSTLHGASGYIPSFITSDTNHVALWSLQARSNETIAVSFGKIPYASISTSGSYTPYANYTHTIDQSFYNTLNNSNQLIQRGYSYFSGVAYPGDPTPIMGKWTHNTTKLYLDFGTDFEVGFIEKNFVSIEKWLGIFQSKIPVRCIAVSKNGIYKAATISNEDQNTVTSIVQSIFTRSGLPIEVTKQKPTGNDFLTVRFGDALPKVDFYGDGTLHSINGIAYNVLPEDADNPEKDLSGVDRFNQRKNGTVGIFVTPNQDGTLQLGQIAEHVAHEAGHGWGLAHINPFIGDGKEVMDYADSPAPIYTNFPADIYYTPKDGNTEGNGYTHNPLYHLKRYVLDETPNDKLNIESLMPGTWDIPDKLSTTITFKGLGINFIKDFYVVYIDDSGLLGEGVFSRKIPNYSPGSDELTVSIDHLQNFSIIGSTTDNSFFDVVLGLDNTSGVTAILSISALEAQDTGNIFVYNKNTSEIEIAGAFSADISITAVPESEIYLSFIVGLACIFFVARRNQREFF